MTFNEGDTVRLNGSQVSDNNGIEGTVLRTSGMRTYVRVTEVPRHGRSTFYPGGNLNGRTENFELVRPKSYRIDDLRVGDKVRVTRTGSEGTEQVVTGTVHLIGKAGTFQSSVRTSDRVALAFRGVEDGSSDVWASQVIELLDRPVPKFDAAAQPQGASVRIDSAGTGVKLMPDTWLLVSGPEITYLSDEEFADRGTVEQYTVLSAAPFGS